MDSNRIWFVRAGAKAAEVDDFISNGVVAIGWGKAGEFGSDAEDSEISERFRQAFPKAKEGSLNMAMGQVKRFLREIQVGDSVMTYDPNQRLYFLGTIKSEPKWREQSPLPRFRQVEWAHKLERDQLSSSTRNGLGSIATLFLVNEDASNEVRRNAYPIDSTEPPRLPETDTGDEGDQTSESVLRDEVVEKAEQFIEDRIARLDWKQLQELVAGILRAMGHKTRVADEGPDRGVDIFASPDGLGLQEPRIFVEVKHRPGTTIGAQEIRSFLGGRQPGDRCLYVSTGGFSKDARYEAERSSVPIMLVNLPQLRELLVEHYENIDTATRSLVPLVRLYWPLTE